MGYRKKAQPVSEPVVINTKQRYVITADRLKAQINNTKYQGVKGEVIEMEPWEANLLKGHVKEAT